MSIATVTRSSKGQVAIPKEIRDELQWAAGTQLTLFSGPAGVTLKAVRSKSGPNLADLLGLLKHDGPPLSTKDLGEPVDYRADWAESEERSR